MTLENVRGGIRGSMTALVTPFRDGAVDGDSFDGLIERQMEGGTDWLVVCGTTGESPTLDADECSGLTRRTLERAAGRCPVMAGTGTNCTRETIRRTRAAADLGAAAALIVTPYYNRPSPEGLFRHYAAIAEATDLPMVLYNVPARTGVNLPMDVVVRLRKAFPHVAALKHATGSLEGLTDLFARSDIAVLCGDDALTFPMVMLGAAGVISVVSNVVPELMKELVAAAGAGDLEVARARHQQVALLAEGLARFGPNPVPIKAALAEGGWCSDEVRLPLVPAGAPAREGVRALLRHLEILTPVLA